MRMLTSVHQNKPRSTSATWWTWLMDHLQLCSVTFSCVSQVPPPVDSWSYKFKFLISIHHFVPEVNRAAATSKWPLNASSFLIQFENVQTSWSATDMKSLCGLIPQRKQLHRFTDMLVCYYVCVLNYTVIILHHLHTCITHCNFIFLHPHHVSQGAITTA